MSREFERPTRSDGGMHYDYRENHPAYGMVGASRVSSTPGRSLFGSDFRHQHYVVITIRRAELVRGLASDSTFATQELIEVAISEAQWATFVSTMNVGHGVPCTLEYIAGEGYVPGIIPDTKRREQFNAEIQQDLDESIAFMEEALTQAKTKAQREPIERAISRLRSGLPFVAEQFDEHAEEMVEKAKTEVEAYLTSAIQRAGLAALGAPPILELVDGEG
jgi:hypothetical protein